MLSNFRPNVLIVEDELLQRRMLANTLKEEGARVVLSDSAEDAMVVLQAIQVSIMLVDIHLNGMNGIEFIRWVRQQPAYVDVPIIVVTAGGDSAMQLAFEAGAHDVIRKPAPPRELLIRVSSALRMNRLVEQRKEKERELEVSLQYLRRDLAAASRLQRNLLPDNRVKIRGIECAWYFSPCDEVGGDLLNYFPLNDREVGLYIIDVAGHGVSAALNAMAINSAMISGRGRVGFLVDSAGRATPPHVVVGHLNRRFQMDLDEGNYFTMTYCVVDCLEQTVSYVQAGQPSAFVLKECALSLWERGGRPVGMLSDTTWETHVEPISVGTRVLMYTDGLPDLAGPHGEMYSELRMEQTVASRCHQNMNDFRDGLEKDLNDWSSGVPQQDDVSFLLFEYVEDFEEHRVKIPATLEGVRELALQLRFLLAMVTSDEGKITRADLAVTELANNIVKHGYPDGREGDIRARIRVSISMLEVELVDDGVPFDPLGGTEVSLDDWSMGHANESSLSLGISLVREIIDEAVYEYRDGMNCLRLQIGLEDPELLEESAE